MRIRPSIIAWAVAWVTAGALASGCDASTDPNEESAGSPTASRASTDDEALRDAPQVGTCWRLPDDALTDPDYWFDDSPRVPCTEPHNTETAQVLLLDEPTVDRAEELGDVCWDEARRYVDVDLDHWVPWAPGLLLPSRQQVADGASFVRCDVFSPRTWRTPTSHPAATRSRARPPNVRTSCCPASTETRT